MKIWKYELEITDLQEVRIPASATILSVGTHNNKLYMWALVDPLNDVVEKNIEIFGTGHPINNDSRKFLGTVIIGDYVWHVFERN